ncbi:hypothetical protein Csa_004268 [Cucumis sativus]|uniref:Uncharacterized protein n=1 Tax=Cucumis sativus TaxID=3659 RepID=A0A0A0KGT4_CUCSA|nr:hypothetical protein Csa_004268 [Cucumis sativus]
MISKNPSHACQKLMDLVTQLQEASMFKTSQEEATSSKPEKAKSLISNLLSNGYYPFHSSKRELNSMKKPKPTVLVVP